MPLTATSLTMLREAYADPRVREMLRICVNSTSSPDANIAMNALIDLIPEKLVVTAANLREIVSSLPSTPLAIPVDEEQLMRTMNLERHMALMSMRLPDGVELCITTAGNLLLDIIVRNRGESRYWNSVPVEDEFVTPDVFDLLIYSDYLLNAVIDLTKGMGLVLNPTFYLSIDDWRMDHVVEMMRGLEDLF